MKTVASIFAFAEYVADPNSPKELGLISGKTATTIERNIIDPMKSIFGANLVRYSRGRGELNLFGRRFAVVGATDESSQDKIRGTTFGIVYMDEITLIPQSFFMMALSRMSVAGARLYGTTNPDNPHHWFKTDYLNRASFTINGDGDAEYHSSDIDLAAFSFRIDDNPYLDEGYVQALKAEYTGLWYRRFILGEWVAGDGAVYADFDPNANVLDGVPPGTVFTNFWLAMDYGTVNAFVCLMIGETIAGELIVVDEYRFDSAKEGHQMTDARYATALAKWAEAGARRLGLTHIDFARVWVDPSAASMSAELKARGWRRVRGANNDVADGIRWTATLLSNGKLKVLSSCVGLIEEIEGYSWDANAAKHGDEKPRKEHDHGPDALRYFVNGTRNTWRHWVT
tara:strand:+ start:1038 stop:2231 length:1194 start_codon:yes stop_codon:yes gene_type:complete